MNCETCQTKLIDFAYEELHGAERSEVAQHLAGCSSCALEFCRLRVDLEGITDSLVHAPSPEVKTALRTRIERAVSPQPGLRGALGRTLGPIRRWLRVLERPVPIYRAALAVLTPVLAWWWLGTERPAETPPKPNTHPILVDYDGITERIHPSGIL